MNYDKTLLELSKIDPNKYQDVHLISGSFQVSEPWHGKILYALGYRTSLDELSKHLLDSMTDAKSKLSKDEKFTALQMIKVFSRILKNNSTEETQNYLRELKDIKFKLKQSLIQDNTTPLTAERLEETLPLDTEKITHKDMIIRNFYLKQSEAYKKTQEGFKKLENETRNLSPSSLNAENFKYIDNKGNEQTFQAYRLDPSQKFIVHATDLYNALPFTKNINDQNFENPNLATSLVNSNTRFFGSGISGQIALILAIDPRQIILTSGYDIKSPTAREGELMQEFYHIHEKLLLASERINQIHHLSGIEDIYQKYYTVRSELDKLREQQLNLHNVEDAIIQIRVLEERRKDILKEFEPIVNACKIEGMHHAEIQLCQLINYYQMNPEKNQSPEEFMKIFHYSGSGIVEEMVKYQKLLIGLSNKFSALKGGIYLQKMQEPEGLLTTTRKGLLTSGYNEINVRLDASGTRPTEVKGLLLTRENLESLSSFYTQTFSQLIQYSKEKNLPIYILDIKPRPMAKL